MIEQIQQLNPQNIVSILDNFNPVGLAFFTNQIKKRQVAHFFTENVINTLRTDKWMISRIYAEKWKQIFPRMIECQATSIDLDNNKEKFILNDIIEVKFCVLKSLNLFNNKIDNIESLVFINAPNLKKLNLIYNNIKSINVLSKCSFSLQCLWIYSQSNVIINHLSRSKSKFQQIGLQISNFNSIIWEDLSFLSKLDVKSELGMILKTKTNKRISQQKISTMLNNKYDAMLNHLILAEIQEFDI